MVSGNWISFDDFINSHLPLQSALNSRKSLASCGQSNGQHKCDATKVITDAQTNHDGSPINDCLAHQDGAMIDNIEDVDALVGRLAEPVRPHGFAISETQFQVFILNASRRLFSDRFLTSSFRPAFYSHFGVKWVNENGPDGKVIEKSKPGRARFSRQRGRSLGPRPRLVRLAGVETAARRGKRSCFKEK